MYLFVRLKSGSTEIWTNSQLSVWKGMSNSMNNHWKITQGNGKWKIIRCRIRQIILYVFLSHLRVFTHNYTYGDMTIAVEELQIQTLSQSLWPMFLRIGFCSKSYLQLRSYRCTNEIYASCLVFFFLSGSLSLYVPVLTT